MRSSTVARSAILHVRRFTPALSMRRTTVKLDSLTDVSWFELNKPPGLPPALDVLWDQTITLDRAHLAESSKRTYTSGARDVQVFCDRHNLPSYPPTEVMLALYCAERAPTHKYATLMIRLCAIANICDTFDLPEVTRGFLLRRILAGVRRIYGTAQKHTPPLPRTVLEQILREARRQRHEAQRLRDAALLLWGYDTTVRSANLVAIRAEHLTFVPGSGYKLFLPFAKNDPEGRGRELWVSYALQRELCPVRAMQSWLDFTQITSGPVFREVHKSGSIQPGAIEPRTLDYVLKKHLASAGLDPEYAPHSLRAGGATEMTEQGVNDAAVMRRMGITTFAVFMRYIASANERRSFGPLGVLPSL